MYEFKRSKKINEQIKIGEEVLTVSLAVDDIAKEFNVRYNAVIRAEQEVEKYKNDTDNTDQFQTVLDAYSNAIINLIQLVFGDENTEKILTFYEDNYIEMMYEVIPFITNVVVPKMKDHIEEERKRLSKKYKGKTTGMR